MALPQPGIPCAENRLGAVCDLQLTKDVRYVIADRFHTDHSFSAIALLETPCAMRVSTSRSRSVSSGKAVTELPVCGEVFSP